MEEKSCIDAVAVELSLLASVLASLLLFRRRSANAGKAG
jgi:hypothetical protein